MKSNPSAISNMNTVLILSFIILPFSFSKILYLSPQATCHQCDGNFSSPFPNLKQALASLDDENSKIILLEGTYNDSGNFDIKLDNKNVHIIGFLESSNVIIDCLNHFSAFYFSNGNYSITNISFKNCIKIKTANISSETAGGTLFIDQANLILNNVSISNSYARFGGAIACINGSKCFIESSIFNNNSAGKYGDSIYSSNSKISFSGTGINSKDSNYEIYAEGGNLEINGGNMTFSENTLVSQLFCRDLFVLINSAKNPFSSI